MSLAFADPWFLVLLPVPLVLWVIRRRTRRAALRYSSALLFAGLPTARMPRIVGEGLRLLALTAIILALAGPRQPDLKTRVPTQGISIMFVLDTSGSMEDEYPWDADGTRVTRREAAKRYDALFAGTGVDTPFVQDQSRHVYHIYSTRTTKRQEWQDALNAKGIQSGIHYPIAIHNLPAYEDLGYKNGDFPHAEKAAAEQLSLPMYPELTAEMQAEVAAAVIELHKKDAGIAR